MKTQICKILIICIELFVGVSALAGGSSLIITNGMGMPERYLTRSLFSSFTIPGIILSSIVGGSHILALFLFWKKSRYALEASAVAGFGLLIWLFTELYIIRESHILQVIYFGIAICLLVLTFFLVDERGRLAGKRGNQ